MSVEEEYKALYGAEDWAEEVGCYAALYFVYLIFVVVGTHLCL